MPTVTRRKNHDYQQFFAHIFLKLSIYGGLSVGNGGGLDQNTGRQPTTTATDEFKYV